jgi:hypothetical protein
MARRRKTADAFALKAEIDATEARIAELEKKRAALLKEKEDAERAAILKIVTDAGLDADALRLLVLAYFDDRSDAADDGAVRTEKAGDEKPKPESDPPPDVPGAEIAAGEENRTEKNEGGNKP